MNELLLISFRSSVVYVCIVLFFRLFGKKEISQLSVIDLVFILLISNAVQNSMVGDNVSLQGGLIAAFTLFLINALLHKLIFKSKSAEKLLEGSPVILINKGKVISTHLDKVQITLEELNATVREHGVKNCSEVDLAIMEVDGNISVLSNNYAHQTTKKSKHYYGLHKNQ